MILGKDWRSEQDRGDDVLTGMVLIFLAGASVWDWRFRRVPNWWVVFWGGAAWFWLIWSGWQNGGGTLGALRGGAFGLAGALFALTCLFPLYVFRMMGAGDIKAMALMAGTLGVKNGFFCIFYGLAAAAAWSLFIMVRRHLLVKRIRYFLYYLEQLAWLREAVPYYCADRDGHEAALCLTPFLLLGFCIYLVEGGVI